MHLNSYPHYLHQQKCFIFNYMAQVIKYTNPFVVSLLKHMDGNQTKLPLEEILTLNKRLSCLTQDYIMKPQFYYLVYCFKLNRKKWLLHLADLIS